MRAMPRFFNTVSLLAASLFSLAPLFSSQTQSPNTENRFSHRRHLALKGISCEDCHYSALSSKLAADDNLPKPETCVACHDGLHAMKHDEGEKAGRLRSDHEWPQCSVAHHPPPAMRIPGWTKAAYCTPVEIVNQVNGFEVARCTTPFIPACHPCSVLR